MFVDYIYNTASKQFILLMPPITSFRNICLKALTKSLKIFKAPATVILSIIIMLVFAEILVRVSQGKLGDTTLLSAEYSESLSDPGARPRHRYDSYLGWVPNEGGYRIDNITCHIRDHNTRSNGNEQSNLHGQPYRLLAVGDSFTYGEKVNDTETWPAYLESLLGLEVINGGVDNYGLDQTVLRAEQLVAIYKPNILLISFIPNDIKRCSQSLRIHPKPYFILQDNALVLRNEPVPLPSGTPTIRNMDIFRRYLGYSYLMDLIMRRVNIQYWLNLPIDLVTNKGLKSTKNDPVVLACLLMKRLSNLTKDPHLTIVVIAQHEIALEKKQELTVQMVLKCAAQQGLRTLDLFPFLSSLKNQNKNNFTRLYIQRNPHMSAQGNQLVASVIAQYLQMNILLPRR